MMIFIAILLSILIVSAQNESNTGAVAASRSQGFRQLPSFEVSPVTMTGAAAGLRGYIPLDDSTRLLPIESSSISTFTEDVEEEAEDEEDTSDLVRSLRRRKKRNRNGNGQKQKRKRNRAGRNGKRGEVWKNNHKKKEEKEKQKQKQKQKQKKKQKKKKISGKNGKR